MTNEEMRAEVHTLQTEQLENYSQSFEAGIVKHFTVPCFCVLGCLGNPPSEAVMYRRLDGYRRIGGYAGGPQKPLPLEAGYAASSRADSRRGLHEDGPAQAAYRVALYDSCVEELTARRSAPVPLTVTVAKDPQVEGLFATGRRVRAVR